MEEKLGIQKLKLLVVLLISFGDKVEDALEDDGKVKLFEALQIGIGIAPNVFEVAQAAPQIKEEIADLSEAEKDELTAFAIEKLDLQADQIENAIEKGLEFLNSLNDFIVAIKAAR